jgi:four helix bundle protein
MKGSRDDTDDTSRADRVTRVGDLKVYRRLVELHLEVHEISLGFPDFEKYELGSQIRRPSNSAPANLAEGFNNKYINMYLQSINRAMGELRETQHHLMIAHRKGYLHADQYRAMLARYVECAKMLRGLERSIGTPRGKKGNSK